ncbi:proton-associated sugar transporter A-like [Uranotaenia lowii]|uniref:proton-associated sugar transporter A-like n=1 Tax=Uranotaenia lowii TaxID=190385 RepID=UPI0024790B67|nr:proton-associated sugar transporter A-like [Uranotaenia lowii]
MSQVDVIGISGDRVCIDEAKILETMLKVRYEHAKNTSKDYSHLFRTKTKWELLRMTAIFFGNQLAVAAETTFASPILRRTGLSYTFTTMAWAIAPVLGFFLIPCIATLSDQNRLSWGRRKPIMLASGIGLMVGLLMLPYGKTLGLLIGDANVPVSEMTGFRWSILLTIIGLVLIDFNAETANAIGRTYCMDMCLEDDHSKALTVAVMIGGVGSMAGYLLGSIDWSTLNLRNIFESNEATVFATVFVLFFLFMLVTLTSFREVPLAAIEKDHLLRPISRTTLQRELSQSQKVYTLEKIENGRSEKSGEDLSFKRLLENIVRMPKALRRLYFTQFMLNLALLSFTINFTHFVGDEIFNGDVSAAEGSLELEKYNEGIRFGSLGLAFLVLVSSVFSIIIGALLKFIKAKYFLIGALLLNSIGMLMMTFVKKRYMIFVGCTTAGIYYAAIFSIPFILLAHYHTINSFERADGKLVPNKQKRGLGTDVSILSSMFYLALLIVSLALGSLVDYFGTSSVALYSASLFSCLAAISASRLIYLDL